MPLLPRKSRALPYGEQVAKTANLRRVEGLVTQLLDVGANADAACAVAHAVWQAAPRPGQPATPLDSAPWRWLREAASDGYLLGEHITTAKVALFADGWQILATRDPGLQERSHLCRPTPEVAVDLYASGLGSVVSQDPRYPLFVLRQTAYKVDALTRTFASRLIELRNLGLTIDPATMQLAEAIVRA
jgi:hypothetical protein